VIFIDGTSGVRGTVIILPQSITNSALVRQGMVVGVNDFAIQRVKAWRSMA